MNEELLKELGLTKYEIDAYLALLDSRPITAYKLGKKSGVPSGRIYDVVDKLALKGLVSQESGKPKKFKAVDPKKAVKSLLNEKDKQWKDTKEKIEDLIPELEKTHGVEDPISTVKGEQIYYQKVKEALEKADEELLTIAGRLAAEEKGVDILDSVEQAIEKNVDIKMIAPVDEENRETAEKISELGADVRTFQTRRALRITIRDGEEAFIAVDDASMPYDRATITIKSETFSKDMKELFLSLWKKAEPIE